ncbi:MAG TPA: ATP-binding cassette domain-containing protein [Caulobacteraceae bacterium]|jgi:zinc/manganese transport system ATP-binding protein
MASVVLENLTLGYAGRPVLRRLDGVFASGKATAVVGPNGAGKSTLLKALAGLIPPIAGHLRLDGVSRRDVAYLAQDPGIDRSFPITLDDLVALGLQARLGLYRGVAAADRRALEAAIAAVGLGGLEARPIAALSGGQFQRALFARVLAQDSTLILLDEPFAAQDARTSEHLAAVVRRWSAQGRTLVLVLHDLDLARALCAETLVLAGEVVAWGPTATTLTPETLERAHALAAAVVEA